MRRQALHHRKHGDPSAVSFLRVSQTDVVSGSYEKLIVEAVDELERTLVPPPSILFINLFCIDDWAPTPTACATCWQPAGPARASSLTASIPWP